MLNRKVIVSDIAKSYENPIGELVQVACRFSSEITLKYDERKINAKSIMGIMAVSPHKGMEMDILADGADEEYALDAMTQFLMCSKES